MTHALTLLLCILGFSALASAMTRHQQELFQRTLDPATSRRLRAAGWLTLLLALGIVVARQGWGLGLVSYSGHTSVGAGLVFIALALRGSPLSGR